MNRIIAVGLGGALGVAALTFSGSAGFACENGGCGGGGQAQLQAQGQQQGQQQGQAQSSTSIAGATSASGSIAASQNAGNKQDITFNSHTPDNQTIKNTPTVYAPGLAAAGSEVCLGSISGGGSGAGFGLTIGATIVDRECQLRLNARTLAVLGYARAARETMCLDADVRQAMLAAGTPCAADAYAAATARQTAAAAPMQQTAAASGEAAYASAGAVADNTDVSPMAY